MAELETDQPMHEAPNPTNSSEAQTKAQIEDLEARLRNNPFDDETHRQYVKILREQGEKEKLTQARQAMNRLFPLSPEMWREWTKDEINGISSLEAVIAIERLYELGVSEYLSVDLWCDYLNFVQKHDPFVCDHSYGGIMKARGLFERALTAAGLHVTEGHRIWELYREFEQAIFLSIGETDSDAKEKQIECIRSLFHRQLRIPLSNLKSTLQAYKDWEADNGMSIDVNSEQLDGLPSFVVSEYKIALKKLNDLTPREEQICKKDVELEKLGEYMAYLKFEHSFRDLARIQILYERAIADFPISTRNCPRVGELWVRYLLSLADGGASEEKLANVFERSLHCTFSSMDEYVNIVLTRVDLLRRKISAPMAVIRKIFEGASDSLSPRLANTKSSFRLFSHWARLELKLGRDIKAARDVWERLIKISGTMLEAWQGFIAWEIEMGHINEARSLYKRCFHRSFAWTSSEDIDICHSWLRFEIEYGSRKDYDLANQELDTDWICGMLGERSLEGEVLPLILSPYQPHKTLSLRHMKVFLKKLAMQF